MNTATFSNTPKESSMQLVQLSIFWIHGLAARIMPNGKSLVRFELSARVREMPNGDLSI
jgi:hypothetical protein